MKRIVFLLSIVALLICSPSCRRVTAQQERLSKYIENMQPQFPIILSPFAISEASYDIRKNLVTMEWGYATRNPSINHYEMVDEIKQLLRTPRLSQFCAIIVPAGADMRITVVTKYDPESAPARVVFISNYDLSQLINEGPPMPPANVEEAPAPVDEDDGEPNDSDYYESRARKEQIELFLAKKNENLPKLLDDGIWLELYETDEEGIELLMGYTLDENDYDIAAFKDIDLWAQMRQAILEELRKTEAGQQQAKELFNRIRVRFTGKTSGEKIDYIISTTEL